MEKRKNGEMGNCTMKQRHMATLNKKMRRRLRELSGLAYERELHQELSQLAKKFDLWRNNEMSSGELSNALHDYDYCVVPTALGPAQRSQAGNDRCACSCAQAFDKRRSRRGGAWNAGTEHPVL